MKKTLLALTLAIALIPVSAALAASLPKPATTEVVVPTSIAGISIGMSEAKAKAAWGSSRGKCIDTGESGGQCEYGDFDSPTIGSAYLYFSAKHKVTGVSIFSSRVGTGTYTAKAAAPLLAIKTSGGLGIGSKYSKLKAAYPKGEANGDLSDSQFGYTIKGKGRSSLGFGLLGPSGKIYSVSLTDGIGG
jgi:hypothetical protein